MNITKMTATALFVSAVVILGGCALSYRPAPYDQHLWRLAESHGYEKVFHAHVQGHGICAAVMTKGVGGSRWTAKWEAEHRGVTFFNAAIGTAIGNIVINDNPTVPVKQRAYRREDGQWQVDIITAAVDTTVE